MPRYENLRGNSKILRYSLGDEYIKIQFEYNPEYWFVYSYKTPGKEAVEEMKKKAEAGKGLAFFIWNNIDNNY